MKVPGRQQRYWNLWGGSAGRPTEKVDFDSGVARSIIASFVCGRIHHYSPASQAARLRLTRTTLGHDPFRRTCANIHAHHYRHRHQRQRERLFPEQIYPSRVQGRDVHVYILRALRNVPVLCTFCTLLTCLHTLDTYLFENFN